MLKQLTYLDVSKNNLEMVDEQISGCENLQDLLISNNALTQLPGSIGKIRLTPTYKHISSNTLKKYRTKHEYRAFTEDFPHIVSFSTTNAWI